PIWLAAPVTVTRTGLFMGVLRLPALAAASCVPGARIVRNARARRTHRRLTASTARGTTRPGPADPARRRATAPPAPAAHRADTSRPDRSAPVRRCVAPHRGPGLRRPR